MKITKTKQLTFSAILITLLLLLFIGQQSYATTQQSALVSVSNAGVQGNADSALSFISADGRFIVFESAATNLVTEPVTPGLLQVYLRDLDNDTTTLISINSAGTAAAQGISRAPTISADGSIVAFQSTATDLVSEGVNGIDFHIYTHNRVSGTTTLISKNNIDPPSPCNGTSGSPFISADGKFVAFHSYATDLVTESVTGTDRQIYLRDLTDETTILISKNASGEAGDNGTESAVSEVPAVSADGSIVAFHSNANNLVSGSSGIQIYIRDLTSLPGTTTLVSKDDLGVQGNGEYNIFPKVSSDGRYVVFTSNSSNLVTGGTTTDRYHVYLYDRDGGTTTLLSRAQGGLEGDSHSKEPFISPDGRYVAFTSQATNLTANDNNGNIDIFVRDVMTNTTTPVSVSDSSIAADGDSFLPSISLEGKSVAFESFATNLTTPSTDGTRHIFVRDKQVLNLLFMIVPTIGAGGGAANR